MGFFDKLFGRNKDDDDAAPVIEHLDDTARRAQLTELEGALGELVDAMRQPPCPVQNPGWQGRIKDYDWALGNIAMLSKSRLTKEGLFDVILAVRPTLKPADLPENLAHLLPLQDRAVALAREMEKPLPSEH